MAATPDAAVTARVRAVFELYDLAERMMRENLRRRDPRATEQEIERRLRAWLRSAPPPGTSGPGPALRPSRRDLR